MYDSRRTIAYPSASPYSLVQLFLIPAPTLLRTMAIVPRTFIPFGLSLARVWIVTIQQKNMNTIDGKK